MDCDSHSFIVDIFGFYQLQYRWFTSVKLIIFDQISHLSIINLKDVVIRFDIKNVQNKKVHEMSQRRQAFLQQLINKIQRNRLIKQSMDQVLNYNDLIYLGTCKELRLLNFNQQDIALIKARLERDCAFLKQNDVTNYSVQLVVERNTSKVSAE